LDIIFYDKYRKQTIDIISNSLKYLQYNGKLQIYAYEIPENHLRLVLKSDDGKNISQNKIIPF